MTQSSEAVADDLLAEPDLASPASPIPLGILYQYRRPLLAAAIALIAGGWLIHIAGRTTATSVVTDTPAQVVTADPAQPGTPAAATPTVTSQIFTVRPGDTLAALFERAGLDAAQLQAVMDVGGAARQLALLHPGDRIELRIATDGTLSELRYPLNALDTLIVDNDAGTLHASVDHVEPIRRVAMATGTLHSTLRNAMQQAGIDANTISSVVNIFHWKVNFRRDIRPGTTFTVLYQKLYHDGRLIGDGPVLAAQLTIGDHSLKAFRFVDAHGNAHYYNEHGRSLTPSLLRTPVHYVRVSSGFSLHRFDPVVHVWRPHWGVDLAAPRGTPIEAAGDGVIEYIGHAAGYGRLVEIRNFGPYSTRYAHMMRFARGLHRGSHVHQGQIIGYVGESGEATGPHLHFEIRVNGIPHDPLRMRLPDGSPIPRRERVRFQEQIQPILAALDHPQNGNIRLAGTPGTGGT